ncbi:hypothetical protein [secondary endosymbiont of Ctenarytaina eucalypti]
MILQYSLMSEESIPFMMTFSVYHVPKIKKSTAKKSNF